MSTILRPRSALSSVLLVLASVSTATAQPTDPGPTFGEIIDVRVINLEVVVTEGGERVRGLRSEDFRLLVDGQELPIEYFTEVEGGQALPSGFSSEAATVPALIPGEPVGTRFLVFIDDAFALRPHRNRVLRGLQDQLPLLGPHDQMAIVAFDGREIELLTSWTRSHRELGRVLEAARGRRAFGLQREISRRNTLFSAPGFGPRFDRGFTPRGSRAYAEVGEVVDAASSVLRGFAKPPGRKVMLLLSGGWPVGRSSPGFAPTAGLGGWGAERWAMRPLIDTANRLGYTLYPIDVKGLESHHGGAEYGTLVEAQLARELSADREWIEESALVHLAGETGGRPFLDGASHTALERALEDTRSYYWLGFSPNWQEDDRRHRVEVEVRRKGLKVRSRRSFSDLSRRTEVTLLVESAQLFDLPVPGETDELRVSPGAPLAGGFRKMIVPFEIEVPLRGLALLPHRDAHVAQLELRVAATDDRGDDADIPVIPFELEGDPSDPDQVGVYTVNLRLRRRPHRLLFTVHDRASGQMLSRRLELTP